MPKFDRAFIDATMKRLERLTPESKPLWGEMTCPQMMGHLNMTIIYSMGKLPAFPSMDNWRSRNIIAPLILNGIIKLPKNLKPPRPAGTPPPPPPPDGNKALLKNVMEMFLKGMEEGSFKAPAHPAFGDIGAAGWAKMHVVHTDHHLRQFGV